MTTIGSRIDETATLIRDGGGFALRRDAGGRYQLDLHRVPVNEIEKHVRVVGTLITETHVDVDGVSIA